MANDFNSGYDIESLGAQDRDVLTASGLRFSSYAAPDERHNESIDPRGSLHMENQGRMSSCVGYGVTTALETIAGLQQGGDFGSVPQLSSFFAYKIGQKCWGREGRDCGCSIMGGVSAAEKYGIPPEAIAPYPQSYNNIQFPQSTFIEATKIKSASHVILGNNDECVSFLDGGFGAIVIGISWTQGCRNCTGRLTLRDVRDDSSRGGHCVSLVGFTSDGHLILANSWSSSWGKSGYAVCDPDAIDYLCQKSTSVFCGVSDLSGFDTVRILNSSRGMG